MNRIRAAGVASTTRADDAGALAFRDETMESRAREGNAKAKELRNKAKEAKEYREFLDAQIAHRERFENDHERAKASANERARKEANERARANEEAREARARREAYVAALDRQCEERRERLERAKIAREREELEREARARAEVEREREEMEEKRRAAAALATLLGDDRRERSSAGRAKIVHSPPASPRPVLKPNAGDRRTTATAEAAAYEAIPETSARSTDDYFNSGDADDLDDGARERFDAFYQGHREDVGDDATTVEELLLVVKNLLLERRRLRARCERAEAALARLR